MSHTTKVGGLELKDTSAMRAAVQKLNSQGIRCELLENAKPRMYYSDQHGKCDYVLKLHDCPYDVGFTKNSKGTYDAFYDEWNGNVARSIGASCPVPTAGPGESRETIRSQHQLGKFMQAYAEQATINAAVAQGYAVESSHIDENGAVQLVLTGM